jgi:hypothetical protein
MHKNAMKCMQNTKQIVHKHAWSIKNYRYVWDVSAAWDLASWDAWDEARHIANRHLSATTKKLELTSRAGAHRRDQPTRGMHSWSRVSSIWILRLESTLSKCKIMSNASNIVPQIDVDIHYLESLTRDALRLTLQTNIVLRYIYKKQSGP